MFSNILHLRLASLHYEQMKSSLRLNHESQYPSQNTSTSHSFVKNIPIFELTVPQCSHKSDVFVNDSISGAFPRTRALRFLLKHDLDPHSTVNDLTGI